MRENGYCGKYNYSYHEAYKCGVTNFPYKTKLCKGIDTEISLGFAIMSLKKYI